MYLLALFGWHGEKLIICVYYLCSHGWPAWWYICFCGNFTL